MENRKTKIMPTTGWNPRSIAFSGPKKGLKMVDITIVFKGVISWFINQLISGGPKNPVECGALQL